MILTLVVLIGLCSLACWIIMLVKIFQSGDTLWGVLGLCPLVAFIYGWVKVKELDAQKIMLIWSVCVAANLLLNIMFRAGATV
ncbi:hypothetical protein BH09PLA1_BH09PLA1_34320 [soil metagenome]